MLGHKIELPGHRKTGEGNIFPALMLGQQDESAVVRQVAHPADFKPEERQEKQFQ